jgi:hypothetical protein
MCMMQIGIDASQRHTMTPASLSARLSVYGDWLNKLNSP